MGQQKETIIIITTIHEQVEKTAEKCINSLCVCTMAGDHDCYTKPTFCNNNNNKFISFFLFACWINQKHLIVFIIVGDRMNERERALSRRTIFYYTQSSVWCIACTVSHIDGGFYMMVRELAHSTTTTNECGVGSGGNNTLLSFIFVFVNEWMNEGVSIYYYYYYCYTILYYYFSRGTHKWTLLRAQVDEQIGRVS